MRYLIAILFSTILTLSFSFTQKNHLKAANDNTVVTAAMPGTATKATKKAVVTDELASGYVKYAKTLIGTPYVYGSVDPEVGLDCSGFVNYVSNHFGIKVPRSSVDFTNVGTTVEMMNAQPGDLILFTGTDLYKHVVGHIGIITGNDKGAVQFIHSSSGKSKGVTITELDGYYKSRLVKIIRIFPLTSDKIVS
jgi:cell wall-associated NlpC family hydrolase